MLGGLDGFVWYINNLIGLWILDRGCVYVVIVVTTLLCIARSMQVMKSFARVNYIIIREMEMEIFTYYICIFLYYSF